MPLQKETKPTDTLAIKKLDQAPKVARMQPYTKSKNLLHQESNSTDGSVFMTPKTAKAATKKNHFGPDSAHRNKKQQGNTPPVGQT